MKQSTIVKKYGETELLVSITSIFLHASKNTVLVTSH